MKKISLEEMSQINGGKLFGSVMEHVIKVEELFIAISICLGLNSISQTWLNLAKFYRISKTRYAGFQYS